MKGLLVTVSGVDLAGKSTQLGQLESWLTGVGCHVERRWHRPGYSPVLDRARKLVRRIRPGALPRAEDAEARMRAFARPGVRTSWLALAVADSLAQYGVLDRARRRRGKVVLCDRYVEDAILDLQFRYPDLSMEWIARVLRTGSARPDVSFLLTLPWPEIERRLDAKAEPYPDPPEVRRRRYDAYAALAGSGRFVVIDAARSIEEVHQDLRGHVEHVLQARA
ncbi:MAG: hypothetical protein KC464_06320 [Myxococcales bacterium]|nr:hypothetical protein [Myxococcales bacterium]